MALDQIIMHVDMDAFYASVEIRDDPSLAGKCLIIGALPSQRGVVATCSYEARRFGVRSGMNIKEAYHLCPHGIYMHPNREKYKETSRKLHEIWNDYASAAEYVALDEAYLELTQTAGSFEVAREFARRIKERTLKEQHLTCSVGVAYSKTAAKMASEEKKPDGYFEILTPQDFVDLILERDVSVLYGVGEKTAQALHQAGLHTVRDVREGGRAALEPFGKQGRTIWSMAQGIDERRVIPYRPEDTKSISRELTFQEDVGEEELLRDVLLLLSIDVANRAKRLHLYGKGVALKVTLPDMKHLTRSRAVEATCEGMDIYQEAVSLLDQVKQRPIRLIGVGIYHLTSEYSRQLSLEDLFSETPSPQEKLGKELLRLSSRYGLDFSGKLYKVYQGDTLYRTVEYMRRKRKRG